jgi:hypothetical protein
LQQRVGVADRFEDRRPRLLPKRGGLSAQSVSVTRGIVEDSLGLGASDTQDVRGVVLRASPSHRRTGAAALTTVGLGCEVAKF